MAYIVDRVVICDAYKEPNQHYQLLPGGKSRLVEGRRPSMRYLASAKDAKGGIDKLVGKQAQLFEDMAGQNEQRNEYINGLRDGIRAWRDSGYPGTTLVTRRLLEWWFERDDERKTLGYRFFFCQQEAVETVIYLYEVQNRYRFAQTGDLVRYALKMATGTGKTVVMAMLITWSTLHQKKVSGSSLAANFLVLVPNLTVRDRVSGVPRGDGLDPGGANNLYEAFDMVPPEYRSEFHPNILVRNWQSFPLESKRADWTTNDITGSGRLVPAKIREAIERRAQRDPNFLMSRFIDKWRDVVVINDEAHHVYGEKRARKGDEPSYIKWNKILDRVGKVARIPLVLDLSATPWYGSGSPKPEGTLFEWLVSDFSVYDAFESGLVKVVRLPAPDEEGRIYIDLWDYVKGAKTKEEYISACKGAIASIYSSWKKEFNDWNSSLEFVRGPCPVLLCVADNATKASWLFDHLTREYNLFQNPDDEYRRQWVTIPIDSKVFDAEKGSEAILREMVNTVGGKGKAGEHVRCIVSVNMLTEGWDVKSVTHVLGLRAFGSPLLTEQIIGRGLRRTSYDVLNLPLEERTKDSEETMDAFGIPFVGFPVEKRKRLKSGHRTDKPEVIEPVSKKQKYEITIPNVRTWAVGISQALADIVNVESLPALHINPKETPPKVPLRSIVGGNTESLVELDEFRQEWPLLRIAFYMAQELFDATNPGTAADLGIGPTFDELLELTLEYSQNKIITEKVDSLESDKRDIGIYHWRRQALDILETAVRSSPNSTIGTVPILASPEFLTTRGIPRRLWPGITAKGHKCHTNLIPCHSDLEKQFAEFLDDAPDVLRYVKNEHFGFSITYYERNHPRQYYPDFIIVKLGAGGSEEFWIAETKGEIWPNTILKTEAAKIWCEKMNNTKYRYWRYLFVPQSEFERSVKKRVRSLEDLAFTLEKCQ